MSRLTLSAALEFCVLVREIVVRVETALASPEGGGPTISGGQLFDAQESLAALKEVVDDYEKGLPQAVIRPQEYYNRPDVVDPGFG